MNKLKVDLIHLPSLGTGQTVYSENLAEQLAKLLDLKIITPNQSRIYNLINHFHHKTAIKLLPFILIQKIRKNSLAHISNQELLFLLNYIKNKKTITLHDFSNYVFYKKWGKKEVELLDKAEKIVCDSDSAKKELTENFPEFEKKSFVVYLGFDSSVKKSSQNIRKKYGVSENSRILLFVGSDDFKKNFFTLLKAFSMLKKENLVLVKIGSQWTFSGKNQRKKFMDFIEENNLQKKVLFLDFIPKQDLTDFYSESDLFVQPSLHEGFGLTLLEAMNCSCPVLCSDIPVFHEIAGNSALFFDSKNEKELKQKIELILDDNKLKKDLIFKGLQNIKRFSWNKTAKETIEVYNKI